MLSAIHLSTIAVSIRYFPSSPPQGISAHEVISYFFDKETRLEWEGTLESVDVVEMLAEDSIIFHQMHKRVWPSTQRETLFCSHLCTLPNAPRPENMVGHTWMVCNFSVDHDSIPVRVCVCVCMQDSPVYWCFTMLICHNFGGIIVFRVTV